MTEPTKPPDPKPEGKPAPVVELKSKLPAADPITGVRKKFYRFRHASHVELAKALVSQLEVIHEARVWAPVYDEGALHCYSPNLGIWERIGEVYAGKLVQAFDGDAVGQSRLKLKDKDVLGALSCARREVWRDGFFSTAPPGLVFKDTHVSVVDGAIRKSPHSTDNRARFAYDFEYVEDEPVAFLKAVRGMFKPDSDIEEKVRFIGEFAGVSLLGSATRLQRWVLLKGLGDDGKSTLIEMIRGAMPKGSTCSIKPEELENEYNRADLAGKLLNTVTEVRQRDVLDAETLKAVVAGDVMRGREIRQSPIDFHPKAGHIMAANGFPRFSDASHGFWRRPIVVTFNRRFTGDPERKVGLAEDVLAAERPRIVCWLIRQGAVALGRGCYLEPNSHYRSISEWRGETDAVYEYVEAILVPASDLATPSPLSGWTSPGKLYEKFIEWAGATGHKSMSTTAFGRRLTELGYPPDKGSHGQRFRPLRLLRTNEVKPEFKPPNRDK
jgi:P4 family phage/plasmid primase-like protien